MECKRNARGKQHQLLSDKAIVNKSKRRHAYLSIAWIDHRKAYEMVPHSRITECLDMIRVAENLKELLIRSMPSWKTILLPGKEKL